MSILIKGMEMPKSCSVCRLFGEYGCPFIGAVGPALTRGERNEDCPLIPVPPHGDLIERDAFVECLATLLQFPSNLVNGQWIVNTLREQPTIIPAEEGE